MPDDDVAAARRYLVWLLSRREYSRAELQARACRKGHDQSAVETALEHLARLGLQSDDRYARMRVHQTAQRWGNRRIEASLKSKKVDTEALSASLAHAAPEAERALELVRKLATGPWSRELEAKLWRKLMTRGFGPSAITAALRELKAEGLAS